MTSLQRAAATIAAPQSKPSYTTANGNFERSFAASLDLSEFGVQSNGTGVPKESAAAELLRIKQEESKKKEDEAAAEFAMEQAVMNRKLDFEHARKKKEGEKESNIVVDAILRMHKSDTKDLSIYRASKKVMKSKARNTATSRPANSGKAFKKSRRAKY